MSLRPGGNPRRSRSVRTGFTLMELVLALGLMAVISVCLYMVYTNAVRVDRQSRRLNESMVRGYMIMKTIETDVLHAVGYRYFDRAGNQEALMFDGKEHHLAFVRETGRGLLWVEYTAKEAAGGEVHKTVMGIRSERNQDLLLEQSASAARDLWFVRREETFQGVPEEDPDRMREEVFTRHLAADGITFSYGRYGQGVGLVWDGVWEDTRLPAAIRIDLKVAGSGNDDGFQLSKVIVLPAGF